MRFRDLLREIQCHEQKLENVLLYVDFIDSHLPVILLKDGSVLILFEVSGVDYLVGSHLIIHYSHVRWHRLPRVKRKLTNNLDVTSFILLGRKLDLHARLGLFETNQTHTLQKRRRTWRDLD